MRATWGIGLVGWASLVLCGCCYIDPTLPVCDPTGGDDEINFRIDLTNNCDNLYSVKRGVPWQIEYVNYSGETVTVDRDAVPYQATYGSGPDAFKSRDTDGDTYLNDLVVRLDRTDAFPGYDLEWSPLPSELKAKNGALIALTVGPNACEVTYEVTYPPPPTLTGRLHSVTKQVTRPFKPLPPSGPPKPIPDPDLQIIPPARR